MAAKIGVISDTHGTLRPDVVERLKDCDYIIHAGDFDRESLLLELEDIGPLCAVRGNNDWGSWTRELPYQRTFTIDGVTFFVTHKREDVPRVLKDEVKVVVFGHSHQYFQSEAGGRLWLTPGSCGRPRFRCGLSMAMLTIERGEVQVERIDLPLSDRDRLYGF